MDPNNPNNQPAYDINKLKLKTAGQLDDKEKDFIRQNVDKLDDEDKDAYDSFLNPPSDNGGSEGQPSAGAADAGGNPAGSSDAGGSGDQNNGAAPSAGTPGDQPAYTFKTEADAQAFVKAQIEKDAKDKQAAIDAAATPAEKKFVEDNWRPNNWNEGIKVVKDAVKQELQEEAQAQQKKVEEHNARVEADWQALRTANSLPDMVNPDGTENADGRKLHDAIVDIGTKMGKKNFKDAYEVYMMVPTDKGGGYVLPSNPNPTPSEAASALAKQKADKAKIQKDAAAKVGGQNPGSAGQSGGGAGFKPTYDDLKTNSRQKLIKRALAA